MPSSWRAAVSGTMLMLLHSRRSLSAWLSGVSLKSTLTGEDSFRSISRSLSVFGRVEPLEEIGFTFLANRGSLGVNVQRILIGNFGAFILGGVHLVVKLDFPAF